MLHRAGRVQELSEARATIASSGKVDAADGRVVVTQQARPLTWTLADGPGPVRYLIRGRDQKFAFDEWKML